jgi:hypothetical protein
MNLYRAEGIGATDVVYSNFVSQFVALEARDMLTAQGNRISTARSTRNNERTKMATATCSRSNGKWLSTRITFAIGGESHIQSGGRNNVLKCNGQSIKRLCDLAA